MLSSSLNGGSSAAIKELESDDEYLGSKNKETQNQRYHWSNH